MVGVLNVGTVEIGRYIFNSGRSCLVCASTEPGARVVPRSVERLAELFQRSWYG